MPSSDRSSTSSSYSFLKRSIFARHWQPTFNVRTGFPIVMGLSIFFAILSVILLVSNYAVYQQEVDYTYCASINDSSKSCAIAITQNLEPCYCRISVKFSKKSLSLVHVFTELTGMYQNHRLYADSFDLTQNLGETINPISADTCRTTREINGLTIVPCGLVPNSLFNDTFILLYDHTSINLTTSSIVSLPEKKIFKNPDVEPLADAFTDFEKPPNWHKYIYQLDENDPSNNGFLNKRYISWMRSFPFPDTLKQLGDITDASRILFLHDTIDIFIHYNYPVTSYDGSKKLLFVQAAWLGMPNTHLGFLYCAASVICLIFAIYFYLCTHIRKDASQ